MWDCPPQRWYSIYGGVGHSIPESALRRKLPAPPPPGLMLCLLGYRLPWCSGGEGRCLPVDQLTEGRLQWAPLDPAHDVVVLPDPKPGAVLASQGTIPTQHHRHRTHPTPVSSLDPARV